MESSLTTLFKVYAEEQTPPIIELQNIDHKPVGALYLSQMRYKKLVVSETNNAEKYFIYVDGIGIYFSFFKKMSASEVSAVKPQ